MDELHAQSAQIHVASDQAVRVTVALDESDNSWFRMAVAVVLTGTFAQLRNESRHVITVMACLGARDGICIPKRISDIYRLAGISETAWRRAKEELLSLHLIEELREGVFRLFPGFNLWARARDATTPTPRTATGGGSTATGGGRLPAPTATGGGSTATGGGPPKDREREDDVVDSVGARRTGVEETAEQVDSLVTRSRWTITPDGVRAMLRRHPYEQVRDAIDSVMYLSRSRGKTSNVQAAVWGWLKKGYGRARELGDQPGLFESPAVPPNPRERLRRLFAERLPRAPEETRSVIEAVYRDADLALAKHAVSPAELSRLTDEQILERIRSAACRAIGRTP